MRSSWWRAGAVLVGACLVVGCTTVEEAPCVPGESRACACSSGATGAQVCADDGSSLGECVCTESDGGQHLEDDAASESDAGAVQDAGRELDGGHDAGRERDAGGSTRPDAGPPPEPDAGPPAECTVIPQGGCEPWEACRMVLGWRDVPAHCSPAGTMPETEYDETVHCYDVENDRDLCEAGLYCNRRVGRCVRHCNPGGVPCPDYWSMKYVRNEEQYCCSDIEAAPTAPYCTRTWVPCY